MDVYTTEEEQIAKIKEWIKNYGFTVFIGLMLAIGITYGYRYWQVHQTNIHEQASVGYEQMLTNLAGDKLQQAKLQGQYIIKEFPRTSYADVAGLVIAQIAVNNKNLDEAGSYLQNVIAHAKTPTIKQIARIRFARLLNAENKSQKALELLAKVDDKAYLPAVEMTKGDIYTQLNELNRAKEAYVTALTNLKKIDINSPLLKMKIDNLSKTNLIAGANA